MSTTLVPTDAGPPAASSGSALPGDTSAYWSFYEQVASRQVADWAPRVPSRVLDVSGGRARFATQLAEAGHDVVQACDAPADGVDRPGVRRVVVERGSLTWLRDGCVDAVLAEARALSLCLATEQVAGEVFRVLRPGGRLLLVVDSLVLGMARLAEQGRWAELADLPSADVVLVPEPADGSLTRCFWPGELVGLLGAAGLHIDWVRPRTVLTPASVERVMATGGPAALPELVATELALAARGGHAVGHHLVVSARRPA